MTAPSDRMQVSAFHAIYKRFRRADKLRSKEEDFAAAIVLTCDEAMAKADPALVKDWIDTYDRTRRKKVDL